MVKFNDNDRKVVNLDYITQIESLQVRLAMKQQQRMLITISPLFAGKTHS